MSPQEPARLGEYRLLEKLGQGGMALVYRGERTGEAGFRKNVAIKRMLPAYRRDPSLLERFAAEARTNARLDHPNLVTVVDFGIDPEPYLVMELIEGVTLALLLQRLVENGHQLEIAAACFIGAEAAQGIDHAHRKRDEQGNPLGIVHRDVSPQNVLLSNEGSVKVSDFGLVKAADNVVQTGSGMPIGKMSYMAPEQADQRDVDARADVFSLGIVVWEMLTMRTLMPPNDPMRASTLLMSCAFPPPSAYNPKVSKELDAIIMACLTRDPAVRTPSAQALGMQLREMLHEVAPGYGRDQLARLLGWTFPERGWMIDEPHETALQPSFEERLSIPQVPAAEAMQRASAPGPDADAPPPTAAEQMAAAQVAAQAQVPLAAPMAEPKKTALPWILVLVGAIVAGAFLLLVLVFLLFSANRIDDGELDDGATVEPATPLSPPVPATAGVQVTFVATVPETRWWLGRRELGVGAVTLGAADLDRGDALVAVAPGFQPALIDAERQAAMQAAGSHTQRIELVAHARPDRAVYVSHPVAAMARLPEGHEVLGPVPGVVLVPRTPLGGSADIEIVQADGTSVRVDTADCDPSVLCVR